MDRTDFKVKISVQASFISARFEVEKNSTGSPGFAICHHQ